MSVASFAARATLVLTVLAVTSGCHSSPSASLGPLSSAMPTMSAAAPRSGTAVSESCPRHLSAVKRASSAGRFRVAHLLPGSTADQSRPFKHTLGSRNAIALLARVARSYRHVPGVELSSATQSASPRLRLWLCAGTITGEEFITADTVPVTLVAEGSAATFVRDAAKGCWRRLPPDDPQTLTNIGEPFPFDYDPKLMLMHRAATGQQITVETISKFWRWTSRVHTGKVPVKSFLTYTIDNSLRLQSVHVRTSDLTVNAVLRVTTLATPPALPRPAPICPADRP
jgi:hypothetical protein